LFSKFTDSFLPASDSKSESTAVAFLRGFTTANAVVIESVTFCVVVDDDDDDVVVVVVVVVIVYEEEAEVMLVVCGRMFEKVEMVSWEIRSFSRKLISGRAKILGKSFFVEGGLMSNSFHKGLTDLNLRFFSIERSFSLV